MVAIYFKRFRMESRLEALNATPPRLAPDIRLIPWSTKLVRDHAAAKFESFRNEIDASVFPCLAQRNSCIQLMKDLSDRKDFVAEATWLAIHQPVGENRWRSVGTIQGLRADAEVGAIQNIGIVPGFRGRGIGAALIWHALSGFAEVGCRVVTLEVTSQNSAALRLYERLGFRRSKTVFKIADVPLG